MSIAYSRNLIKVIDMIRILKSIASQWVIDIPPLGDLHGSNTHLSPDKKKLLFSVARTDMKLNKYTKRFFTINLDGSKLHPLNQYSSTISNPRWSPKGNAISYLVTSAKGIDNLWLLDTASGKVKQLTGFKQSVLSYKWAPNGEYIVLTTPDPLTQKEEDAIKNHSDVIISGQPRHNHLWLLHTTTNKVEKLTDGDFSVSDYAWDFAYDWSPDSKTIVFDYQKAPGLTDWVNADIALVDIATKKISYIKTDHPGWKYFPRFSPDGKYIAITYYPGSFRWWFDWRIAIVPVNGGKINVLAPTPDQDPLPMYWTRDGKSLYFFEYDRISNFSMYRIAVDGSSAVKRFGNNHDLNFIGMNKLDFRQHIILEEPSLFVFVGQAYNSPPEIYVSRLDKIKPKRITHFNDEFLKMPQSRTDLIHWKSKDGVKIEGMLTYPLNYDKSKKYPLVLLIHGGPNFADFNMYQPLIKFYSLPVYSRNGYFILQVNYRGSLGYGLKFRTDLVGNVGVKDYEDLMSGVDYVMSLNLINPNKMAVVGHSNGGTLTSWVITQTNRFNVACMSAGETDFISLIGTNEFPQMQAYLKANFTENLQVYLDSSPIFHIKNVKTPLLIQGGLLDKNVPHSQLIEFYRALKRNGHKDLVMISYPDSNHDFFLPKRYLHFLKSNMDWVEKYFNK